MAVAMHVLHVLHLVRRGSSRELKLCHTNATPCCSAPPNCSMINVNDSVEDYRTSHFSFTI